MSPRAKTPTLSEQLDDLHRERVRIAVQRATAESAVTAAGVLVERTPELLERAVQDEAMGRDGRTAEIRAAASEAAAAVSDGRITVAGLKRAEGEIGEQVEALEATDEAIAQFGAERDKRAEHVEKLRETAEEACREFEREWRQVHGENQRVRRAYRRRGEQEHQPPEVPLPDFGSPLGTMSAHHSPYPTGSRSRWEEIKARTQGLPAISPP